MAEAGNSTISRVYPGAGLVGKVAEVVSLIESSIEIYDLGAALDDTGIPKVLEGFRAHLPPILQTLVTHRGILETQIDSIRQNDKIALEEILSRCTGKARDLKFIFGKIIPVESYRRLHRLESLLCTPDEASWDNFEDLTLSLAKDVWLLRNHHTVNFATGSRRVKLNTILNGTKFGISVQEEDSGTRSFKAPRHSRKGDRRLRNDLDWQHNGWRRFETRISASTKGQFNVNTQGSGEKTQEDAFGFRGPVAIHLDQAPQIDQNLFIGRISELDEIEEALNPRNAPQIRKALVLAGKGGIGKTQIAITYARLRYDYFQPVFWLDATSEATLIESFRLVASRILQDQDPTSLSDDKTIVEGVHRWLSHPTLTRWLLIFDNYGNYDKCSHFAITDYYPSVSSGDIIVTTRQPDLVPDRTHTLHIEAFDDIEDSLKVLQTRSKLGEDMRANPFAWQVAEELRGNPLALATAGTYIQRSHIGFDWFLQRYEEIGNSHAYRAVHLQEYPVEKRPFNILTTTTTSGGSNTIMSDVSHDPFELDLNPQEFQESYQSDLSKPLARSDFSLQSMQSTTISIATEDARSNANELSTALDEVVDIFLNDKELEPLYPKALLERCSTITLESFVRTFRRLLKCFAADLKEESQEAIDIGLANFISSRSAQISNKIGSRLEHKFSQTETNSTSMYLQENCVPGHGRSQSFPTEQLQNASSDDEDEDELERELDKSFIALVSHGRGFIEESMALKKLREDFRKFVIPMPPEESRETEPEDVREAQLWHDTWSHLGFTRAPNGEPRHEVHRLMMQTRSFFTRLLSETGLLEKTVPEHHQRLRWTNRHGKQLYDDYVEHRPGALKALQEYLTTTVPADPNNSGSSSQSQSSSRAMVMYTPGSRSLSTGVSTSSSSSNNTTAQPTNAAKNFHTGVAQNTPKPGGSSTGPLLLLFCIERRGHPIKLYQEFVTNITDDRELFHSLRKAYHSRRTKFKSFWSLRTLHGIHFMKFAYGGHGFIDVRRHPEPCVLGKPCACIPPADRVFPQGKEYACQPIPSELSPPIGPKAMMDCFKDPDSRIAGADWVLQQLPKKIGSELDPNKPEMSQAWGIYYQEDWDWMRIWVVLGIAFFPPSLLFGVHYGEFSSRISRGLLELRAGGWLGQPLGLELLGVIPVPTRNEPYDDMNLNAHT